MAEQLFFATAEFRATNLHTPTGTDRPPAAAAASAEPLHLRPFKAVVVLYMRGGCDSYNMLMPYENRCSKSKKKGKALDKQYKEVRGEVAIDTSGMIEIAAQDGHAQPCSRFGVHKSLELVANLYKQGQAAFVANIGNLIEPVGRAPWKGNEGQSPREAYEEGKVEVPPAVFAHNTATRAAQSLNAREGAAKGVLGRMLDALGKQSFRTGAFSFAGNVKMIEAESVAPDIISAKKGAVRFQPAVMSGDGPCALCKQIDAVLRPTSTR